VSFFLTYRRSLARRALIRVWRGVGMARGTLAPPLVCFLALSGSLLGGVEVEIERLRPKNSEGVGFVRRFEAEREMGFSNTLSEAANATNRILENGAGVSLGDVDGDGWCDIYLGRLEGENMLFRNRGDWRFDSVLNAGGASCESQFSTGVLLVDIDTDQDLDLIVCAIDRPVRLFINDGQGALVERLDSGLLSQIGGTSMACADVDVDGDLDLYVCHYRDRTVKDESLKLNMRREEGLWVVPSEYSDRFISTRNLNGRGILLEQGIADKLYLNDGRGQFQSVAWDAGYFRDSNGANLDAPPLDWSLSASFADVNDDGFPDLYVCADFISPDRFWINQGGKGFQAADRAALSQSSWSSMCVDWADIDLDGDWDFFVGDMLSRDHQRRQYQRANHTPNAWTDWAFEQRRQYMRNTLFLNRGDSSFAELGRFSGLAASEWTWNCLWLDVDRDGAEDLLITNGHPHDSLDSDWTGKMGAMTAKDPNARLQLPSLDTPNLAFQNQGELRFIETGAAWGFDAVTHGQGVAMGDLDRDGDQDIVVNPLNSSLELYENIGGGNLIAVQVVDHDAGRTVYGSKITLTGGKTSQIRELRAGGRYLSGDDLGVTFGTGDTAGPYELKIRWPDGETSIVPEIESNISIKISRGLREESEISTLALAQERVIGPGREMQPFFEDISASLNALHEDHPFDDSKIQPMLTQQLSGLAMGLGWFDVDHNGWDDLVLGAGNKGRLSVIRNVRGTQWIGDFNFEGSEAFGDQTALSYFDGETWLVGTSGYEDEKSRGSRIHVAGTKNRAWQPFDSPGQLFDGLGPVTTGDVDLDGDLDVFVGGRHRVGRFPEPSSSVLLRQDQGDLNLDRQHVEVFRDLGMVSGALFCHLNEDEWIDLAISLEWGGIRVFVNHSGTFSDQSNSLGLGSLTGLWQSIDCGDFNGDGRLDLVAGNWGRNRFPVPSAGHPLRLYYGEAKNPARFVQLESHYDEDLEKYVSVLSRDRIAEVLPEIVTRYSEYRAFGKASVEEILGSLIPNLKYHEGKTLDSVVLLNKENGFVVRELPWETQISPVFGLSVADFDGDAKEDLFVSQNFYGTELDVSPFDAGIGLWLKGDGLGGFEPVESWVSGLRVYGAGRGSAVSDFDRDGRWDLVVGRHGRTTRLYRNQTGKKGVRVGLIGSEGNRAGVGARIGLRSAGSMGPIRFISGGSGDGGQDTVRPILYCDQPVDELWVKWPNGVETVTPVPANVVSILVGGKGEVVEIVR
jgi:enediyne biosynthesis protein E4